MFPEEIAMRKIRFTDHQIITVLKSVEAGRTGDKIVPLKKTDILNSVKKEFGLPGKWR
jgi:hypothetical protein